MPKLYAYLALLRGINVGGNNIIKMMDLKACFEQMGFSDVQTYIQTGNVIFAEPKQDVEKLTSKIEKKLAKQFNYHGRTVVVPHKQLRQAVELAPKYFGADKITGKIKYRCDVIFLRAPLTAKEAIKQVKVNLDVDIATAGKNVLYFSRLDSKASKSRLSRIIQLPIYQFMTIRNWNTTTKLLDLMEERSV